MARIFIALLALFLWQSNAQAQTPFPLRLSPERDTSSLLRMSKPHLEDFNLLVEKEVNVITPVKIFTMMNDDTNYHINNFFESQTSKCLGNLRFDFYPLPGACYQSNNKRIQFLVLTALDSGGFIFLYKF